jgi:hypothetical protein
MDEWPKIFEFPSKSDPSRSPHRTRLFEDGGIVCECMGFQQHNKCWHLEAVRNKPIGYRDPRISISDKHDVREAIAEGDDETGAEILFKIFPSATRDEIIDLMDQICTEEEP